MQLRLFGILTFSVLTGCSSVARSNRNSYFGRDLASSGESSRRICNEYQNVHFIFIEKSIARTCESFNFLDELVADFERFKISKAKPFLGSIVVSRFAGWNWGEEDPFWGTIHFFIRENDPSWKEANIYIFAHEVGHLLLDSYIAERHPVFTKLLEIKRWNSEYFKYLLPILELRESDPSCSDANSICGRKIEELIVQSPVDLRGPSAGDKLDRFKSENKAALDRFFEIMGPYHELFADLFESLFFDNPNSSDAIALGIGQPSEPCRTFTAELPSNFKSDDPHCSFSSIRKEMWQKVVVPSLPKKKEILYRVADAIWAEAPLLLRSPETKFDSPVAAKGLLNRLLLKSP